MKTLRLGTMVTNMDMSEAEQIRSDDGPPAIPSLVRDYAQELFDAFVTRKAIKPLRLRGRDLTIDDAYAISLQFLDHRLKAGERVVGKKIGVTSKAVQDMLRVHQPDFGFLTDRMRAVDGATVSISEFGLIQPRAEAEIAFVMSKRLYGPGVTAADVLAATGSIAPCFEIVDSRIEGWNIGIIDTVADNASCGIFVLGAARAEPRSLDLPSLGVTVFKNGMPLSSGVGAAVQGSPLAAVAWLTNTLGERGVALNAGDIILSGSLVPLEPACPGDHFEMTLENVGSCSIRFS